MRFLLLLITISLIGCFSTKEHNNFKYAKGDFILQEPTLLRTDGIYLYTSISKNYEGKTIKGFSFYRFFKNGRCYSYSWREGVPNDSILKSIRNEFGEKTFYRLEGNKVNIESWGGNYVGYVITFGTLDSNKLTIQGYKPRGVFSSRVYLTELYNFIPLNLSEEADW